MKLMQLRNIHKTLLRTERILKIEQDIESMSLCITYEQGIVAGDSIYIYYSNHDTMMKDLQAIVDRSDK